MVYIVSLTADVNSPNPFGGIHFIYIHGREFVPVIFSLVDYRREHVKQNCIFIRGGYGSTSTPLSLHKNMKFYFYQNFFFFITPFYNFHEGIRKTTTKK